MITSHNETLEDFKRQEIRSLLLDSFIDPSAEYAALVDAILVWAYHNYQTTTRVIDSNLPWLATQIEAAVKAYDGLAHA